MVAHLVEALDQCCFADHIADARTGKTIGLGEGAKAQEFRIAGIERRQGAIGREFAIGFIEDQKRGLGDFADQLRYRICRPP